MKNTNKIYNLSAQRFILLWLVRALSPLGGAGGGFLLFVLLLGGLKGACQSVCTGDSVILTLTGYNGTIQWQQSLNLTAWSPASGSGISAIHDKLHLTASNTSYYRAKVTDGECLSFYSDTALVTIINTAPAMPSTNSPSGITQSSFSANWNTTSGAKTYYLDVATDSGFTSFVAGYNDLDVGNVGTHHVTGLGCNTSYYYRVRAFNACGASANSGTMNITTYTLPPVSPTASVASNVANTFFDANWIVSDGATIYYLDVSTSSNFGVFIAGYNNTKVTISINQSQVIAAKCKRRMTWLVN